MDDESFIARFTSKATESQQVIIYEWYMCMIDEKPDYLTVYEATVYAQNHILFMQSTAEFSNILAGKSTLPYPSSE